MLTLGSAGKYEIQNRRPEKNDKAEGDTQKNVSFSTGYGSDNSLIRL